MNTCTSLDKGIWFWKRKSAKKKKLKIGAASSIYCWVKTTGPLFELHNGCDWKYDSWDCKQRGERMVGCLFYAVFGCNSLFGVCRKGGVGRKELKKFSRKNLVRSGKLPKSEVEWFHLTKKKWSGVKCMFLWVYLKTSLIYCVTLHVFQSWNWMAEAKANICIHLVSPCNIYADKNVSLIYDSYHLFLPGALHRLYLSCIL